MNWLTAVGVALCLGVVGWFFATIASSVDRETAARKACEAEGGVRLNARDMRRPLCIRKDALIE